MSDSTCEHKFPFSYTDAALNIAYSAGCTDRWKCCSQETEPKCPFPCKQSMLSASQYHVFLIRTVALLEVTACDTWFHLGLMLPKGTRGSCCHRDALAVQAEFSLAVPMRRDSERKRASRFCEALHGCTWDLKSLFFLDCKVWELFFFFLFSLQSHVVLTY